MKLMLMVPKREDSELNSRMFSEERDVRIMSKKSTLSHMVPMENRLFSKKFSRTDNIELNDNEVFIV